MSKTREEAHGLPKKIWGVVTVLRSAIALLLGFLAILLLTSWTHGALRRLGLLSHEAFGMYDIRSNLLALTHRSLFAVLGSYVTASLAPRYPMRHALALGVVLLGLSIWLAIFRIRTYDTGPVWYAVTLAVTALPCAWLGGFLRRRQVGSGRISEQPVR
jgi:hypothetical protein